MEANFGMYENTWLTGKCALLHRVFAPFVLILTGETDGLIAKGYKSILHGRYVFQNNNHEWMVFYGLHVPERYDLRYLILLHMYHSLKLKNMNIYVTYIAPHIVLLFRGFLWLLSQWKALCNMFRWTTNKVHSHYWLDAVLQRVGVNWCIFSNRGMEKHKAIFFVHELFQFSSCQTTWDKPFANPRSPHGKNYNTHYFHFESLESPYCFFGNDTPNCFRTLMLR